MNILTILDYSTGTTVVCRDPAEKVTLPEGEDFDYDQYITEIYGKMEYHYMVGTSLDIDL